MTSTDQQQQNHPEEQRQYVWLIRYGRTDPPLLENIGNYDSDLHYPDGIAHAKAVGERLSSGVDRGPHSIPKIVYSDPFLRCMRTADVVVKTLNDASGSSDVKPVKIRVEQGTTEWQVPSLLVDKDGKRTNPRTLEELVRMLPDTVDGSYLSVNPQGPDRSTACSDGGDDNISGTNGVGGCPPRFPETEEQLYTRCRTTLRKILNDVGDMNSIAIVGHAPCVQSIALALEGSASPEDCTALGPWSLGGMTLFSRPIGSGGTETKWTLELYSDTAHMPGEFRDGRVGQWSLPGFLRD
mmetsp:Transcript_4258/g.9639  ORF Transcript_4258/g.9639 Transcript_4258/m.9639 type:complete len:296 (+) Transcript_4258:40-927(+)